METGCLLRGKPRSLMPSKLLRRAGGEVSTRRYRLRRYWRWLTGRAAVSGAGASCGRRRRRTASSLAVVLGEAPRFARTKIVTFRRLEPVPSAVDELVYCFVAETAVGSEVACNFPDGVPVPLRGLRLLCRGRPRRRRACRRSQARPCLQSEHVERDDRDSATLLVRCIAGRRVVNDSFAHVQAVAVSEPRIYDRAGVGAVAENLRDVGSREDCCATTAGSAPQSVVRWFCAGVCALLETSCIGGMQNAEAMRIGDLIQVLGEESARKRGHSRR